MPNKKAIDDWKNVILGTWVKHDEISCNALREYDMTVDSLIGKTPYRYMEEIAVNHGTTIEEMKKHWKCIQREN